ncbi:MAG: ParB/RepB/Spo0J family partition protein [Thermodesulfobacteriota bacterium]
MTILPPIQEIFLSQVDLEPHPFLPFPDENLIRLQESLAVVGLLSLPRVRPLEGGRWQPVTGWKRLKAAALLGWEKIPALVLSPGTPEAQLLLLYLHDNAFTRAFNPLEQARLAVRLLNHWERETLVAKGLPLLGLPPAPVYLDRLLASAGLEASWQELVAREHLALTAAARLAAWEPADRAAALPFLADLPWSRSKQEEFLTAVEILARREGRTPADFLLEEELQKILADTNLNPQERAQSVRDRLNEQVSPRFSAAKRVFQAGLDRLGLRRHPRLRLKEPPAFEGPDFELTLKFKDSQELRQLLQELSRLAELPDFEALVDI